MSPAELLQDFSHEHYANIQRNRQRLIEHGINFTEISSNKYTVREYDFYPSSGLYENRMTGRHGKGFFNLLKELERKG